MRLSSSKQWPNLPELRRGAKAYKEAIESISMVDYEIGRWKNVNPLGFLYNPATGEVTHPPFSNEEGERALKEVLLARRRDLEAQVERSLQLMLQSGSISDVAEELCRNDGNPT